MRPSSSAYSWTSTCRATRSPRHSSWRQRRRRRRRRRWEWPIATTTVPRRSNRISWAWRRSWRRTRMQRTGHTLHSLHYTTLHCSTSLHTHKNASKSCSRARICIKYYWNWCWLVNWRGSKHRKNVMDTKKKTKTKQRKFLEVVWYKGFNLAKLGSHT